MKWNTAGNLRRTAAFAVLPLLAVPSSFGWGDVGHRMINRLAMESLPADVPAFMKTPEAIAEVEYLGPEPDRWRSPSEPELSAAQAPDHFIDFEYADVIGTLPRRRYDYIAALTAAEITHPDKAAELQPSRVGFQPYITNEIWERLKAAMRQYRDLSAKDEDTKPVEAAILFYAGWLGHYAGDGSQPLHVSINYNGWALKDNPNGYTTEHTIHAKFESTFVADNIKAADVRPLLPAVKPAVNSLGEEWDAYMSYLRHSQSLVEQLYQIDKRKGFDGAGTPEGKQFTEERLAAGAGMLRDLVYSAWVESAKSVPDRQQHPTAPVAASARSNAGVLGACG
ncbi:MAG: nuclease [Silvibacterium sp.]|nr:nuclease [Silvibacterium sp.]MBV8436296.1 nuclease [Silvibacterium sp.]